MYSVPVCVCVHAAVGEFEESASKTNRLEEMRKIGGDKWLSFFNTEGSAGSSLVSLTFLLHVEILF